MGTGKTSCSGTTTKREAEYTSTYDKTKFTCDIDWKFFTPWCHGGCKAVTTYTKAMANKIVIHHKQGGYQFESNIFFEKEATVMRIVNTWNKVTKYCDGL